MILNKVQILKRIEKEKMIENYIDLGNQIQPAGFDLTVKNIFKFTCCGTLDFDNSNRTISSVNELHFVEVHDGNIVRYLEPGTYQIEVNERFNIPLDIIGITISRSSLQRCGAAVHPGFFDPGYSGKGVLLLSVYSPYGLCLHKNAKVSQMYFNTAKESESYNGIYQEKSQNR